MNKEVTNLPFRKRIELFLATTVGWILVHLLHKSYRIKVEGAEVFSELKRQNQPFLVSIWHGRFFVALHFLKSLHLVALVSQHLDGEMVARILVRLGFGTIRGSSTRGGKEAFHKIVDTLKSGRSCVIIPDGPNGPRHKLKPGVIYMAYQAQVPVIPFTFSAKSAFVFNSWDRYMMPKPFARIVIKIGQPLWPPEHAGERDMVAFKKHLESIMVKQEQEADEFFAA